MAKRGYTYALKLNQLSDNKGDAFDNPKQLTLEFDNHDEVFDIIERTKSKNLFNEEESTAFALGLKLFSEVMLKNRKHPLFEEFAPAFGSFMKKFKSAK